MTDLMQRPTQLCLPGYPIPGQLLLPAPKDPPKVDLTKHPKVDLSKPPAPPRKPPKTKQPRPEPKPFSGKIKLYWQEITHKDDIIIEIHDPEIYAAFEILHGTQEMETYERWQNCPEFELFYKMVSDKADIYADRIKRLKKLHVDKWDWDWVY